MSLFRKPAQAKIGLKVLAYGGTGVGKSTFGLTFPKIAVIDSESGLARYENNPNIISIANTSSVDDLDSAISEVEENTDTFETFIVDSETKIYDTMQVSSMEHEEKRAKRKGGDVEDATISIKGWGKIKLINKRLQNLKIDLSSKGVHIVGISQMEDIKEKRGENFVKIGEKPAMAKGVEYDYDIILKLYTEKDNKGNEIFKAIIEKDRTGVTKRGQIVENPTYNIWKEYVEQNAQLKERPTTFAKDVDKDVQKLAVEEDQIGELIEQFKTKVKLLSKENQPKVMKKSKEFGIDNPLKTTDVKGLTQLIEYIDTLE